MTKRFQECLQFVLFQEGGYVNRPEDRGGATNKGITQAVYTKYLSGRGLPVQSVRFITEEEAADIYYTQYWVVAKCDDLPYPIDLVVFDSAVNHGPRQSAKFLQWTIEVKPDGVIGRKTLEALETCELTGVVQGFIKARHEFYEQLVKRDPSQKVFLNGWKNRLEHLKEKAEKELNHDT